MQNLITGTYWICKQNGVILLVQARSPRKYSFEEMFDDSTKKKDSEMLCKSGVYDNDSICRTYSKHQIQKSSINITAKISVASSSNVNSFAVLKKYLAEEVALQKKTKSPCQNCTFIEASESKTDRQVF